MENSDIDNVRGLSGVDFEGDDRHSSEKVARVYEFYESGRYQEALSMAEADPQISAMSYGQVLMGNCYKKLGSKNSAMAHWKKAVEISPLEHSAYINIANELYEQGNAAEAICKSHSKFKPCSCL